MRTTLLVVTNTIIVVAIVCMKNISWAEAPASALTQRSSDSITIGWVGDMVPSDDALYAQNALANVEGELQKPDLMIGNLEGTFALGDRPSKCVYFSTTCYAFRGDPSFANALKRAGIDLVSLVNNHSYDFGEAGLADTEAILDAAGIPYIAPDKPVTSMAVQGKHVGILGLSSTDPGGNITDYPYIKKEVAQLKATNDFVIVIFHGGAEGADKTAVTGQEEFQGSEDRGNVEEMARTAVDAGADVVVGSGPHVLRKIEQYQSGVIAYSLGNFVGGTHLSMAGTLALSGIFTATLDPAHPTTTDFTSVILSRDGVPSVDSFDQGRALVKSLSQ